jgi:aspartate/methionine/tyrosine aminotransferase
VPRHPARSADAEAIRTSTFEAFAAKLRAKASDPDFVPLHLGDTHPLPPASARAVDMDDPALHRYGPVTGSRALRDAAAADLAGFGLEAPAERVFVTPGATGALDLALNATLQAGDEVLVLTPTWPLLLGLLQRRGCSPVEVDVDPSGWLPDDPELLRARLEEALTPATCGISLCNPNNPSGFIYGPAHLSAVADVAEAHDLWVYYDAVYVDLVPNGDPRPLASVAERLSARAFVATSYSKSFGLAGHRVGLCVAPPSASDLLPRLLTHSVYHTGNLGQAMALASLAEAADARALRVESVARGRALVGDLLGALAPHRTPAGGAFAFLDLRERCQDEAALLALLERCLDAGVSLTPGGAFGASFGRFARVCFTATPLERLEVGLRRVATVLQG